MLGSSARAGDPRRKFTAVVALTTAQSLEVRYAT
jgi:hypothetical protein